MKLQEAIAKSGVVAVLRNATASNIREVVETLKESGVFAIEITVENEGGYAAVEACKDIDGIALGAGTVLTLDQARKALVAGATFIVSPILDVEVVKYCKLRNVEVVPGAFTPSEITKAAFAGADMVKLFPAVQLGPDYLKNIKAPLPRIPIMVTGGIGLDNAYDYLSAGASAIGIGSQLVDLKKSGSEGFLENIRQRSREFVSIVEKARKTI
jgi:2-dehydro-3-deoxyphosphogluconate aldolase/(4S)-4-hydroxy-2-oxoglutarate aldolase